MPQSLSNLLVHLIFSTRNREPRLTPEVRSELHRYLIAVLQNHDCPPVQVGGTADHVHILFALSRTASMAKIVEVLKTSSSKWLKTKGAGLRQFHWQKGYGAFSVSQSEADRVSRYILGQEAHQRKMTFQEEYRRFLEKCQVAYDERHVWD